MILTPEIPFGAALNRVCFSPLSSITSQSIGSEPSGWAVPYQGPDTKPPASRRIGGPGLFEGTRIRRAIPHVPGVSTVCDVFPVPPAPALVAPPADCPPSELAAPPVDDSSLPPEANTGPAPAVAREPPVLGAPAAATTSALPAAPAELAFMLEPGSALPHANALSATKTNIGDVRTPTRPTEREQPMPVHV